MTRETKVGLVVGTGIILLIGIIVSDHLAANNRGSAAVPAPPGYVEAAGTNGQPRAINPRGYERPTEPAAEQRVQPISPAENFNPNRGNGANTRIAIAQVEPGAGNNAASGNNVDLNAGNSGRATNSAVQPNNGNTAQHTDGTTDRNLLNALRQHGVLDEGRGGTGNAGTGAANTLANGNTGSAAGANGANNTTQPPVRQPEPIVHYVQPGERLWSIAEQYYGNGKYWTIISQSNADKMVDARQGIVREGVRLVIPHKSAVVPEANNTAANNAANNAASAGTALNANEGSRTSTGNGPIARTVKVEAGDNLTRIAERHFRSSDYAYVKAIVEANRDQIRDADDIKAGMLLRMPDVNTTSAAPANTSASSSTTTDRRPADNTPRASATKTYTVQSGDTFSSISSEKLGTARRWSELHELNKATVPNPNALREGIVLVLPADAR